MPRPHRAEALSDDARLTSVCLSRTSGLSREAILVFLAYRKTKIGTEVAHVTSDSDITFKVKRSKVNLQGRWHIVAASRTARLALYLQEMRNINCLDFPGTVFTVTFNQ